MQILGVAETATGLAATLVDGKITGMNLVTEKETYWLYKEKV
jgi:hypothetical protein